MDKGNKTQVFNLDDMLSRPVVNQAERPSFILNEEEQITDVNDVLFDEIIQEETRQQQQPVVETAEQVIDEGFMPHRDMAETIVNLLDGMQSSFLPLLIEKRTFTEKERETLQKVAVLRKEN